MQSIALEVKRKTGLVVFCVKLAESPIHNCRFPARLTPHKNAIPSFAVLAA